MTRQELIDYCLSLPDSYEDYPFDEVADESAWTAIRHQTNKKCFAFITVRNGRLMVNLKCDPMESDFLRQAFFDVEPGFHMNKTHWNSVYLNGDVPDDAVRRMIAHSYDLIKPKMWKGKKFDG